MLELKSTKDLFEDKDIILVETIFESENGMIIHKDAHIKDKNDEVVDIRLNQFSKNSHRQFLRLFLLYSKSENI